MSYADAQHPSLHSSNAHTIQTNNSVSNSEGTPPGDNIDGNVPDKTKHRRNYQACEPCRERKVKCDLGDVDNPTAGPCAKCAREKKHCWFRPQRKKDGERAAKRQRLDSTGSNTPSSNLTPAPTTQTLSAFSYNQSPPSSTRSVFSASSPPAPHIIPQPPTSYPYSTQPPTSHFARPHANSFVIQQNNLNQTYGGVGGAGVTPRSMNGEVHIVIPQANSLSESFTSTTDNMSVLVRAATSTEANGGRNQTGQRSRALTGSTNDNLASLPPRAQEARKVALEVWSQMRFVRAGWFTADEALQYVEYFYTHLAPMTPVVIHDFRDPTTHRKLLTEEPVLALAILAITSRYYKFESDGAVTRGYYIHEKLWDALRKIVQRLLWGQEQFGGGFCGAGMLPTQESITGQITWKGSLRTLGTIEACLLLTDWQPRALHFPPGDDENKLVGASFALLDDGPVQTQESGNLPYSNELEPAWRSDRMSWMLLGVAQSLAFELGVFDTRHTACGGKHGPDSDCSTRRRLRRLVIAYVSQVSGRIGIQSSLAPYQDRDQNGPDFNTANDKMQKLWFKIASIMFDANCDIFPSRHRTAELVENGQYKTEIAKFEPRLKEWFSQYQAAYKDLSPHMQHILRMEYEYARLYINSLGLQKVVGRMAVLNRKTSTRGPSKELIPVMADNQQYIDEVRSAAEQILESAHGGLGNMQALSFAPVRTFLRSLSGMMFILKLFSLGAEEKVARANFKLLTDLTTQMCTQVVDDVHLGPQTAKLIQRIMFGVHNKMIRIPKPGSRGQSRQMSPQPHPNTNQGTTSNGEYLTLDRESPDVLGSIPMVDYSTQTFMPPPNFDTSANFDAGIAGLDNMDPTLYTNPDDWISLPIDNLFDFDASTVSQGYGGIGPTLGHRDMLAILTGTSLDQTNTGMINNFGNFGSSF